MDMGSNQEIISKPKQKKQNKSLKKTKTNKQNSWKINNVLEKLVTYLQVQLSKEHREMEKGKHCTGLIVTL